MSEPAPVASIAYAAPAEGPAASPAACELLALLVSGRVVIRPTAADHPAPLAAARLYHGLRRDRDDEAATGRLLRATV